MQPEQPSRSEFAAERELRPGGTKPGAAKGLDSKLGGCRFALKEPATSPTAVTQESRRDRKHCRRCNADCQDSDWEGRFEGVVAGTIANRLLCVKNVAP